MADDNPFLALFEPIQQKSESVGAKKDTSPKRDLKEDNTAKIVQSINQEIENILPSPSTLIQFWEEAMMIRSKNMALFC